MILMHWGIVSVILLTMTEAVIADLSEVASALESLSRIYFL